MLFETIDMTNDPLEHLAGTLNPYTTLVNNPLKTVQIFCTVLEHVDLRPQLCYYRTADFKTYFKNNYFFIHKI